MASVPTVVLAGARVTAVFVFGLVLFYIVVVLFQRRLVYFPPREDPLRPSAMRLPFKESTLVTADGVRLAAWMVPPPRPDGPVVLFFHGNATNLSGLVDLVPQFRHLGFGFAAVDYRGYGRSGGSPSERGLRLDALAAYRWVQDADIPPQRIILYGQSLGGGVASWLAGEAACGGLILEGAFPSVIAMARVHYRWLPIPEFLVFDRFRTADAIKKARCPVLFLHGAEDTIVPAALARSVYDAAPEPKQWIEVRGAGHNEVSPAFPDVTRVLREWRSRFPARLEDSPAQR